MRFLDGFKTVLGAVGVFAATLIPKAIPEIEGASQAVWTMAQGAFGLLTVLGVVHKVEKARR